MKKTIILAVLGSAAICNSYGQGLINFSSYLGNNGIGAQAFNFGTTTPIGNGFTADLYYFIGTISDAVDNGTASSVSSLPIGLTDVGITGVTFSGGYFDAATVQIPGYSSGPITFEVVAFNGSSYANSTIRGRSGTFTMTSINTVTAAAGGAPTPSLGDNGTAMPDFYVANVAAVPEPSTLALAGLGGFGMLMALRRKKA